MSVCGHVHLSCKGCLLRLWAGPAWAQTRGDEAEKPPPSSHMMTHVTPNHDTL